MRSKTTSRLFPRSHRPWRCFPFFVGFLVTFLCLASPSLGAVPALRVLSVTPFGDEAPLASRIVVQLDRQAVPRHHVGQVVRNLEIRVEPHPSCQWRWLSTATLACALPEGQLLAPATAYRLVLDQPFHSLDGGTLLPFEHVFRTVLPRILTADLDSWQAPEVPRVLVRSNQPLASESMAEHLYFLTFGGHRIDAEPCAHWARSPRTLVRCLRPGAPLPPGAAVRLMVEPGLGSAHGPLPGNEQRSLLEIQTVPATESRTEALLAHNPS